MIRLSPLTVLLASTPLADHFRDLFLGPPGPESGVERAARLAASRDILADLLDEGAWNEVAREDALHAVRLRAEVRLRSVRKPPVSAIQLERAA